MIYKRKIRHDIYYTNNQFLSQWFFQFVCFSNFRQYYINPFNSTDAYICAMKMVTFTYYGSYYLCHYPKKWEWLKICVNTIVPKQLLLLLLSAATMFTNQLWAHQTQNWCIEMFCYILLKQTFWCCNFGGLTLKILKYISQK